MARVGVLDRVLERLLGDAEHLEVARRICRRLVLDRELDLEPFEAAHEPDVLAERPAEPVEREVDRPELEHERAQLLERVLRQGLQPLDLIARRGRIAVEQRPGRLGAEDEAEQLLAHRVVELEREAVALGDDGELARLLLEARVRDRDRRMRGEQPDQVVVLVAEVGRRELLGEVEGADHAVRGDDRDAEERPHVGMRLGPPAAELGMLVDVVRAVRRLRVEHRAEHAVLAGQRAERGDQLVVHARGEEAAEATLAVGQPERGEAGAGEHAGAVDEPLQDLVDREPRRDREHGVADRRQCMVQLVVQPLVHPSDDRSGGPRCACGVPLARRAFE